MIIMGASLFCDTLSLAQEKADESIFKYKKDLSITDTQEKNLRGIREYFRKKMQQTQAVASEQNRTTR